MNTGGDDVTGQYTIQVDKHIYYVNHRLGKRPMLVHLDAHKRCLHVTLDGNR